MRRFELSLSMDYVPNWTYIETVREIFQNALDEQIEDKFNEMYVNYEASDNTLRVGNKHSVLKSSSLLMGCTSKRDNEGTIGRHGEGYKVAALVLLREGCSLTVYNYGEREIWRAKVVKSRKYKCSIVAFDVEKVPIWSSVPDHNLVFEITGITQEMFKNTMDTNLHMMEMYSNDTITRKESKAGGSVLLDERFKGSVFVNGLYVCKNDNLEYGYDFPASMIDLDRDRGLVTDFDILYSTARILRGIDDTDFVKGCVGKPDGSYYSWAYTENSVNYSSVCNAVANAFYAEHGSDAVPVKSMDEFNSKREVGVRAVFVQESVYATVRESSMYKEAIPVGKSLSELLQEWYEKASEFLPDEVKREGDSLMEKVMKKIV